MAEAIDLKSIQCWFESNWGYKNGRTYLCIKYQIPNIIKNPIQKIAESLLRSLSYFSQIVKSYLSNKITILVCFSPKWDYDPKDPFPQIGVYNYYMSPRGFYTKEYISPYFTSSAYLNSEQHKEEIENMSIMYSRYKALLQYPAKIARSFWIWALVRAGYIKDLSK